MPHRSCFLLAAVVTLALTGVKTLADERDEKVDQLRQQAERMLVEAEELARSGKPDAAERVAAEARRVREQAELLARSGEARAARQRVEMLRAEIRELSERGRGEEAERLEKELRHLLQLQSAVEHESAAEGEHHHPHHPPKHAPHGDRQRREEVERKIHHLHAAAENLHAAGMVDQARELHERAERMERELRAQTQHPEPPPHAREIQEMRVHIEKLQDQVNQLRELVEDLRQRLKQQ